MTAPRRKVAITVAAFSAGVLALVPQAASAGVIAPESSASSDANDSMIMYGFALAISVLVIFAMIAALLRILLPRGADQAEPARRTTTSPGTQRHVAVGIGVAAVVLFVIGIVFTERVRSVDASEADPITVRVTGQQWLWRYTYPAAEESPDGYSADQPYSYYDLTIPVDTPVTLEIGSTDTVHRWWVPELTRSVDAVPGDTQSVTFIANEEGTYEGRSTEFSGPGYATMRTEVHVVAKKDYDAFLAQRALDIKAARAAVQEKVDAGTAPGVALEQTGGKGE